MNAILGTGGKVRGYLKENANGQVLLAPGGRVLGYYLEDKNMTTDAGGKFQSYGNTLLLLLEN